MKFRRRIFAASAIPSIMNLSYPRLGAVLAALALPWIVAACGDDLQLGSDTTAGGSASGGGGAGSGAHAGGGTAGSGGCNGGACACSPGAVKNCGSSACGPKTQLCADGVWSSCEAATCADAGPVACVSNAPTYVKYELGGRAGTFSTTASSGDRILTITPTAPGGNISISQANAYVARTMAPDGTDIVDGTFFDRGGTTLVLHEAVWVDPYYYVAWHEQPAETTWVGRLDHDGKAVGTPLAIGSQSATLAIGAGGGRIVAASMGTAASQFETVLHDIDPGTFTLGAPIVLQKGKNGAFLVPTGVAILGDTVGVAARSVAGGIWSARALLVNAKGDVKKLNVQEQAMYAVDPGIAANGATFLFCGVVPDGSFGLGRDAFHQWCATLSPEGTFGDRADLGYRSNFLALYPQAFAGGFAVNLPGGDQSAVGLTSPWQHLAILDLDGATKEQLDVTLPSPSGDNYSAPVVIAGDCLEMIHFDVQVYNTPDQEQSGLQQFCQTPCP